MNLKIYIHMTDASWKMKPHVFHFRPRELDAFHGCLLPKLMLLRTTDVLSWCASDVSHPASFLRPLLGWVDSAFFCAGSVNAHLTSFLPSFVFDSIMSDLHGICSPF